MSVVAHIGAYFVRNSMNSRLISVKESDKKKKKKNPI